MIHGVKTDGSAERNKEETLLSGHKVETHSARPPETDSSDQVVLIIQALTPV